ncbi:MAG: NAD(P)/FAD-dependent oxidoreductase, partial [Planctomycetaceae bacterium]
MRIAVIGGGISGLSAAWMLSQQHSVTVFESEPRPGGHSRTIQFSLDCQNYSIDVGFIVYNDRTYPLFMELLQLLGVPGVPTEMSFAVRCDRTGVEYSGTSLNGLFAQRSRLLSPSFIRMVLDILRFNSLGTTDADCVGSTETVGQYLRRRGFGKSFKDHYLLPMGAAIWSCPMGTFADFPIQFILEFYRNHGLLSLTRRPQWYTIPGGSRNYVSRLIQPFADRIVTDSPVRRIRRTADAVTVITDTSEHAFDEVVIAC